MNVSNAYDDAIISYSAYFRVVFSFIYSFIHSFTLFGSGSCVGGEWDTAIDHFKSIITHLYNLDYWYFNYSMPHYTHRTNPVILILTVRFALGILRVDTV